MSSLQRKPASTASAGSSANGARSIGGTAKTQRVGTQRYDGQIAPKMGHVRNGSYISPAQVRAERNARRRQKSWAKTEAAKQGEQEASVTNDKNANVQSHAPVPGSNMEGAWIEHQPNLFSGWAKQATKGEDWDMPPRLSPRNEVIARLVQDAEDDVQKVLDAQLNAKKVVATVTGSMAYHYKRISEQFEDENRDINVQELTAYLDQLKVAKDGRDRHIFARVARLAKTRINSNLRNKIADIVAGACLFGIHSDDLAERCKQGFELGPEKKIGTGPSALGQAYREHEAAQMVEKARCEDYSSEVSVDGQDGSMSDTPMNWPEAVRVLNDAVTSGQVPLHFLGRGSRMVRIGRVEHRKEGPVFVAA